MSDERPEGGSGPTSRSTTLAGEDSLLTGPSAWTAPRQRTGSDDAAQPPAHEVVSVDHRDRTSTFDNTEFQLLRERLFGSAAISSFPVSLRAKDASDESDDDSFSEQTRTPFPVQVEPQGDKDVAGTLDQAEPPVEPGPEPALAEAASPPDKPVDWATASAAYAPTTEERESRGWLLTILALLVVGAGVVGWLTLGTNNPRATTSPNLPNTTGATAAAIGATGLVSDASVTPNLMVLVTARIVFAEPTSSVTLTIPDRTDTGAMANYDPAVHNLEILVGGEPLSGVNPNLAMGESTDITFPAEIREFSITYRASGAVNLSKPSKEGRGLAWINAITVSETEELPSTITVSGPRILSLGCVAPGQPIDDCGTDDTTTWIYTGVVGDSILAQVDLPPTD